MEPAVIEQAAYILIAIGAFILIISVLGYCGALKESRVLLTAYGIFLIIIFLLQVYCLNICNTISLPLYALWFTDCAIIWISLRLLPSCCALCTSLKQTITPKLSWRWKDFFMPPNMFRDPFHHVGLLTFLEEGVLSAHIVCAWEGATGGFAWLNTWVIARTAQRSMTGPTLKKCYSYCNTFQWPEVYH